MDTLGFRGVMLFGNVNGTPLSDRRFWPLYAAADERSAVCFIHPTHPLGVEAMSEWWLMPLVGFPFDTTLAAASLVFSGVVERFPRIRWVLGTSAAPFRTWRSGSIGAIARFRAAVPTSRRRRVSTCGRSTTTPSISTPARSSSRSTSRA
jgi:predicted TIM-barrel fold metal-dependent hydrolase